MLCPNDNVEMSPVKIESHYGQPIIIDQCKKCGGIWFDNFELSRAKLGEAVKIEQLNAALLASPTVIQNSKLLCPRDKRELARFNDAYFPKDIIVARCPVCEGFWLNRGEFTKYQQSRSELKQPKEIIISNSGTKSDEAIQRILEQYQSGSSTDTLTRLGKFLSTPVDNMTLRPEESAEVSPAVDRTINIALNVLMLVLRFFLR